jgi:hypothetical protein
MADLDSKAAAAEFRELFGIDFDEFTRQAPVKLLLGLARFAEPIDLRVLQFADESHPLFQQQRERLNRALRHAWQLKAASGTGGGISLEVMRGCAGCCTWRRSRRCVITPCLMLTTSACSVVVLNLKRL